MKKTILLALVITIISAGASAQVYNNAAGIRLGPNSAAITAGFSLKHFLNEKTAIEGIVGVNNGLGLCGLYELHFPIEAVENLQWFAGGGAYVAFRSKVTSIGAAGIIGLDYKFVDIPLNLSLDWKPEFSIINPFGLEASGLGLSARFTF